MSNACQTLRRFSIHLPRPLWILLTAVVLVTIAVAILLRQFESRQQAERVEWFYRNLREIEAGQTTMLSLFITKDTDSLLNGIRGMPEVEWVISEHSDLTDEGMQHLATLPNLRHILLYDSGRITDRGLRALHACDSLESIELYGTWVTEDGVAELHQSLPGVSISLPTHE